MSRLRITLGALVPAALTPPAAMAQGPPPGPPVTAPAQPTRPGLLNAAVATFKPLWSGSADQPKHSSGMPESSRK
jgi:hypothetical protein